MGVELRDNGIGINSRGFERMFMIFRKLNPGDRPEGTGIGLAIRKKVVDRHRAYLGVFRTWAGFDLSIYFSAKADRRVGTRMSIVRDLRK